MLDEQRFLCRPGLMQGGPGVWSRLRRSGSRKERDDWQMGQLILGRVQNGVQGGDGCGQCEKIAHRLEGRGQNSVPECICPCRCP